MRKPHLVKQIPCQIRAGDSERTSVLICQHSQRLGHGSSQTDAFNVWLGRLLPPSDRANLDGPFYLLNLDFPFVSAFPAIFAGRDDGGAIWGELLDKHFKYQVGVFNGVRGKDSPNRKDSVLLAARLVYNFLDPEPGYYNASTYYGSSVAERGSLP